MAEHSMFKLVRSTNEALSRVCIVGVGRAGMKVVEHLLTDDMADATVAVIHTDDAALSQSKAQTRVQIGKGTDAEGGCGGSLERGRKAAEQDVDMLRGLLSDCDLLVLVGGLGGGTAGGALPVVARLARSAGIFSAAVVTLPFGFEGEARQQNATDALQSLTHVTDFTAVVSNDELLDAVHESNLAQAFAVADAALAAALFGIWQLIARPGLLALDQGDFRALMGQGNGYCRFVFGMATGPDRVADAQKAILSGPAGPRASLAKATGVLACICSSRDLTLSEVGAAIDPFQDMLSDTAALRLGVVLHGAWRSRLFLGFFFSEPKRRVSVTVREVRQGKTLKPKPHGQKASQEELNLEGTKVGRGRFANIKATILDGEDLDVPTFIRRGIKLER